MPSTTAHRCEDGMMMNVKPLHDERDYDWAVSEVTRYFESKPKPGTNEGDRFEVLASLIKEYEDKHFEVLRGRTRSTS
jgi:HTH-type transcriptional regulator / antitoxin HigA